MIERPILFSAPMVRALLNGTKTQTRRVVKPQPDYPAVTGCAQFSGPKLRSDGILHCHETRSDGWQWVNGDEALSAFRCPYGQPGDRLWVRETWMYGQGSTPLYRADTPIAPDGQAWRPSIFMPRAASRITLEITAVRVERLKDISESDALSEGVWTGSPSMLSAGERGAGLNHVGAYANLWDRINGPGSWDLNPWVWVIEFKTMKG